MLVAPGACRGYFSTKDATGLRDGGDDDRQRACDVLFVDGFETHCGD